MTSESERKMIDSYLDELRRDLSALPGAEREMLVDDIRQHIAEQIGDGAPTEAQLRQIFDDLGTPAEIANAAASQGGRVSRNRRHRWWWVGLATAVIVAISLSVVGALSGTPVRYVATPSVVAQREGPAIRELHAVGLHAYVVAVPPTCFLTGFVVGQDPAIGFRVPTGSTVRLAVCRPNRVGHQ
jgi:hypothetical protein